MPDETTRRLERQSALIFGVLRWLNARLVISCGNASRTNKNRAADRDAGEAGSWPAILQPGRLGNTTLRSGHPRGSRAAEAMMQCVEFDRKGRTQYDFDNEISAASAHHRRAGCFNQPCECKNHSCRRPVARKSSCFSFCCRRADISRRASIGNRN